MLKFQIIDYVLNHFSKNPRAIDRKGFCQYLTNGKKCAHSICIDHEKIDLIDYKGNACALIETYGDEIHLPQFQGHEADFWNDIQKLHDFDCYWEGNKLTEDGELQVKNLKQKYA